MVEHHQLRERRDAPRCDVDRALGTDDGPWLVCRTGTVERHLAMWWRCPVVPAPVDPDFKMDAARLLQGPKPPCRRRGHAGQRTIEVARERCLLRRTRQRVAASIRAQHAARLDKHLQVPPARACPHQLRKTSSAASVPHPSLNIHGRHGRRCRPWPPPRHLPLWTRAACRPLVDIGDDGTGQLCTHLGSVRTMWPTCMHCRTTSSLRHRCVQKCTRSCANADSHPGSQVQDASAPGAASYCSPYTLGLRIATNGRVRYFSAKSSP